MTDLLLDDNGDFKEDPTTLDWVEGDTTAQNQKLLLLTEKGNWKELPAQGVGAYNFMESEDEAGLLREIRLQFTGDGMTFNTLQTANSLTEILAAYSY